MTNKTTGRGLLAKRAAACIVGSGLILGIGAPMAQAATTTDTAPKASAQEHFQQALDRAQQAVVDAQAQLDAAKDAEAALYAQFETLVDESLEAITAGVTKIATAQAAVEAAKAALDAAEKALEDAVKDIDLLKAGVEAAKELVAETEVDGKDALKIVADDYLARVSQHEAAKALWCKVNANGQKCKDATAAYDTAHAAHKEFAAPHEQAAAAYADALAALVDAEARLAFAENNLGDLAIEVLRLAHEESVKARDAAIADLLDTITNAAAEVGPAAAQIAKAEADTEWARGKLRTAKAVLAELMKHVGPVSDGTQEDVMESESDILDGTGDDDFGVDAAPEPVPPVVEPSTPEAPEVPAPPVSTPDPGPGNSTAMVTKRVVYKKVAGKWTTTSSAVMPKGASFTVKSPMKPKAKDLKAAKTKAKKMAAKHSGKYAGVTKSRTVKTPRVVITWKSAA